MVTNSLVVMDDVLGQIDPKIPPDFSGYIGHSTDLGPFSVFSLL